MKKYKQWIALLLCAAIFCLLAGCNQSKYPAQTVRMNSSFSPELDKQVTVVQSEQDLDAFTQFLNEKLNELLQDAQSSSSEEITSENYDMLKDTTYASAIEKYDANFFTDQALLMVFKQGSGVDEYMVTKLTVDNNQGELHLREIARDIAYNAVVVHDVIIIEIPHDLIADSYTVTVEW